MKNKDVGSIEKKKRMYKWARRITFAMSIGFCIVPVLVAAIDIVPRVESKSEVISISVVGAVIASIVVLVVLKSLIAKYISILPYSSFVLVGSGILLALTWGLKQIIDDAIAILTIATIGACVGFAFELASRYCKNKLAELKERYKDNTNV